MAEKFVQVGVTAMRDPATGNFLPAVPLFVRKSDVEPEAEEKLIEDIGRLLALRIRDYEKGCARAGVPV